MPTLDLKTVLLNTGLMAVLATLAMVYVWRVHHRELAVRYWVRAFAAIAAGTVLAYLRLHFRGFWTFVFSDALLIGGTFMLYAAIAQFAARPIAWRSGIVVTAACAAATTYCSKLAPDFALRTTAFSLGVAIACAMTVHVLLRSAEGVEKRTYYPLAVVFGWCGIAALIRAGAAIEGDSAASLDSSAAELLWFVTAQATIFLAPFGFLLMNSQRLQLQLQLRANTASSQAASHQPSAYDGTAAV